MFFSSTFFLGILAQLLAIFEFDIQASQKGFFVTEVNDMFASVIFLKKSRSAFVSVKQDAHVLRLFSIKEDAHV